MAFVIYEGRVCLWRGGAVEAMAEKDLYIPGYHLAPGESPSSSRTAGRHHVSSTDSHHASHLSPAFSATSSRVVTSPGSPTTLQCFVVAEPLPKVQWFHDGVECVDGEKFRTLNESSSWFLVVKDVGAGGEYRAVASNMHGSEEFTIHVTVLNPLPPQSMWL